MKRFLVVLAAALSGCAAMSGGEWQTLIDGDRGMDNFNVIGDANWRAQDGTIMADRGKSGYLVTKATYADFEIRAEFWAEANTNSGIFLRCSDPQKPGSKTCYEVNIWDVRPEPKYGTGAIVNVAAVPVPIMNKAGGHWNTMVVSAKGSRLTVDLNNMRTVDVQNGAHASGFIGLQYGAGLKDQPPQPIKWRKVEIRPL